jgi:acyl-coenzyme A synthetase/AMP-(fatty) acid ligase
VTWCRDRLAHFKAIREVAFLDALPRSEAGKVQRSELLALHEGPTSPAQQR